MVRVDKRQFRNAEPATLVVQSDTGTVPIAPVTNARALEALDLAGAGVLTSSALEPRAPTLTTGGNLRQWTGALEVQREPTVRLSEKAMTIRVTGNETNASGLLAQLRTFQQPGMLVYIMLEGVRETEIRATQFMGQNVDVSLEVPCVVWLSKFDYNGNIVQPGPDDRYSASFHLMALRKDKWQWVIPGHRADGTVSHETVTINTLPIFCNVYPDVMSSLVRAEEINPRPEVQEAQQAVTVIPSVRAPARGAAQQALVQLFASIRQLNEIQMHTTQVITEYAEDVKTALSDVREQNARTKETLDQFRGQMDSVLSILMGRVEQTAQQQQVITERTEEGLATTAKLVSSLDTKVDSLVSKTEEEKSTFVETIQEFVGSSINAAANQAVRVENIVRKKREELKPHKSDIPSIANKKAAEAAVQGRQELPVAVPTLAVVENLPDAERVGN